MTATAEQVPATPLSRYIGPPPFLPAIIYHVLFVASIVIGSVAGIFGRPNTAAADLSQALTDHAGTARAAGLLQTASGVLLGIFTAAVVSAVRSRVPRVAGLDIARFGGYGAALMLILSGLSLWSAAELADGAGSVPSAVKALSLLSFATGGPACVALSGLLIAGLAVPLGASRLIPAWAALLGVILAVVAQFSLLSLVVDGLQPLLPIARFPGAVWLLAVAAILTFRLRRSDQ